MQDRQRLRHHAGLLDQMAQARGIDLEEAVLEGQLRFDDIADAVLRCADCPNPGHCQRWLELQAGAARPAPDTPEYCRNREMLNAARPAD